MQTDLVVSIGLNSMVQFKRLNMVGQTELYRVDLSCMLLDKPMHFSPLFQGRPSPQANDVNCIFPPISATFINFHFIFILFSSFWLPPTLTIMHLIILLYTCCTPLPFLFTSISFRSWFY